MADEITIATTLQISNGNYKDERKITRLLADQTTQDGIGGVQEIGFAAHEAVALGDVTTAGMTFIRNIDATNFVEIGVDVAASFHALIKLLPGEPCVFRAGAVLYAQADTAAVKIDKLVLEV